MYYLKGKNALKSIYMRVNNSCFQKENIFSQKLLKNVVKSAIMLTVRRFRVVGRY